MRRVLVGLLALVVSAPTAHAQVSEDDLAPFVGKYADSSQERQVVFISSNSGMIVRWHFGSGCHVAPPPCDPPGPFGFTEPGGMATAALWRREGNQLHGTVLSTNQAEYLESAPVRVALVNADAIEVRQGERVLTFERVKR